MEVLTYIVYTCLFLFILNIFKLCYFHPYHLSLKLDNHREGDCELVIFVYIF